MACLVLACKCHPKISLKRRGSGLGLKLRPIPDKREAPPHLIAQGMSARPQLAYFGQFIFASAQITQHAVQTTKVIDAAG
jgi:hypothetical protein